MNVRYMFQLCLVPTSLMLSGCTGSPEPEPTGHDNVTYAEHIRPLIADRCAGCHTDGGIAPFALSDYETAKSWAAQLADSVAERRMPPYYADSSGDCGSFRDSLWMSDSEIAQFVAWSEHGAPSGDLQLPAPPNRKLPTLAGPITRVDIGTDYLPDQSAVDDYQCFVVDSPGAITVRGFNVVPGNKRIVHHLIAYQVYSPEAAQQAHDLVAATPGDGYDCLGTGPLVDAVSIAGWAPGQGAVEYPDGLGFELDPQLPLVIEMHYNLSGGPGETDRTTLEFQTGDEYVPLGGIDLAHYDWVAPAGMDSFVTSKEFVVDDQLFGKRVRLIGASPHMHELGVSQKVEIIRAGGGESCAIQLPRWDFNWQQVYWYDKPMFIEPGDRVRLTCEYDTSQRTAPVTWGDRTEDEMCLFGFLTTPAP